jgi:hypothetical protein
MTTKGAFIAAAVAGLFASAAPIAVAAADSTVHCQGVNACKGKGGCKSADNSCKGHNGCKGKGFVEMSEKDCTAKGGTVAPAKK